MTTSTRPAAVHRRGKTKNEWKSFYHTQSFEWVRTNAKFIYSLCWEEIERNQIPVSHRPATCKAEKYNSILCTELVAAGCWVYTGTQVWMGTGDTNGSSNGKGVAVTITACSPHKSNLAIEMRSTMAWMEAQEKSRNGNKSRASSIHAHDGNEWRNGTFRGFAVYHVAFKPLESDRSAAVLHGYWIQPL